MNWKTFIAGNIYSYNWSIAFRFRQPGARFWEYSDEFLVIPEPNWSAENNSESDSEYIGYAGEYELKLLNTFGGLFLYIDNESSETFDVECKLGSSNQYAMYNEEFIHEIQAQLETVDILHDSRELLKKYFKLHKKTDPTSQKNKIKYIKVIISNVLQQYNKDDDFKKFYNAWIKFEVILNIVEIRDHFIHNFETFLLGLYFLDPLYTSGILEGESKDNIFKWTFTSIMHDIGYAVEKSKNVLNKLSDLYSDIGMNTISSRINTFNLDKLVLNELYTIILEADSNKNGLCTTTNIKYLIQNKLKADFPNSSIHQEIFNQLEKSFNHGLVSSVLLIRQLLESKGYAYINTDSFKKITDSAIGILFHHFYPTKIISLSPKRHLMIILLLIIDELQEWSRPLEDYGANIENKRLEYELFKISTDSLLEGNVNFNITIKLKINQTDKIVEIVKNTLSEKKDKFSLYNYELGKSKIQININVIDLKNKEIIQEVIVIKDKLQIDLGL